MTAINPTPAGEGKTTTSVGLGEAFAKMGKKAVIALREPSLGPCWPDFTEREFDKALIAYQHRERRFGGLKQEKQK